MTLIKGTGLTIHQPPRKKHQKNAEFHIAIELRTHNDINQGNGVKN